MPRHQRETGSIVWKRSSISNVLPIEMALSVYEMKLTLLRFPGWCESKWKVRYETGCMVRIVGGELASLH